MLDLHRPPLPEYCEDGTGRFTDSQMFSFYADGVRAGMERAAALCDRRETLLAAQADKIMAAHGHTDAWHFCMGIARGSARNAAAIRSEVAKNEPQK